MACHTPYRTFIARHFTRDGRRTILLATLATVLAWSMQVQAGDRKANSRPRTAESEITRFFKPPAIHRTDREQRSGDRTVGQRRGQRQSDSETSTTETESSDGAARTSSAANGPVHAYARALPPDGCDNITKILKIGTQTSPSTAANKLAQRPAGRRVVFPRNLCWDLCTDPRDLCITSDGGTTTQKSIWPDHGKALVRQRFDHFFQHLKAAGGEVDIIALDYEEGYGWGSITPHGVARIEAIQNDPRLSQFYDDLGYSNLMQVYDNWELVARWNAVMAEHRNNVMNEVIYDVVKQYYPDIKASNYNSRIIDESRAVPDAGGQLHYRYGSGFGSHDAAKFYGIIEPGLAAAQLDGENAFGYSPFAGVLVHINRLRAIRSSSDREFHPWIVGYSHTKSGYHDDRKMVVSGTPYYDEFIFQIVLHSVDEFMYWNLKQSAHPDPATHATDDDDRYLNALINEINAKVQGQWGDTVSYDPIPWDTRVIATGLQIDDRVLWRFTVQPNVKHLTVRCGGQDHELIREGDTRYGMWFEHPAGQTLSIVRINDEPAGHSP